MPQQPRRPRPPAQPPVRVVPPVVDVPPETLPPPEPEPAAVPEIASTPVEPPPFDPDDPQPGQSISAFVPHSGYTSFAYGDRSFEVDPDTDLIVAEIG